MEFLYNRVKQPAAAGSTQQKIMDSVSTVSRGVDVGLIVWGMSKWGPSRVWLRALFTIPVYSVFQMTTGAMELALAKGPAASP